MPNPATYEERRGDLMEIDIPICIGESEQPEATNEGVHMPTIDKQLTHSGQTEIFPAKKMFYSFHFDSNCIILQFKINETSHI